MEQKQHINELLVITMEECAELIQECSKRIRFPDTANEEEWRVRITKEAGDVLCMINLLIEDDLVSEYGLPLQAKKKLKKLKNWSSLFKEPKDIDWSDYH